MLSTVTFTADASKLIANIRKSARDHTNYLATILVYGTFGSGTLSLYLSPDGGTTKIAMTGSPGGTGVSFTANGMTVFTSGTPTKNTDTLQIYATLAGSTNPSLTVANYDNNN